MNRELLTIDQVCEMANIGKTYARRLLKTGELKAVRFNKKPLIPREAFDEWKSTLPAYAAEGEKI